MNPVAIVGIALGVGLLVYALTLRGEGQAMSLQPLKRGHASRRRERDEERRAVGFGGDEPAPPDPFTYVPVSSAPYTLRTRLLGLGGLILLIVSAAAVLAFAVYQAGHVVNQMVARFVGH
jgi:hypothetical protein